MSEQKNKSTRKDLRKGNRKKVANKRAQIKNSNESQPKQRSTQRSTEVVVKKNETKWFLDLIKVLIVLIILGLCCWGAYKYFIEPAIRGLTEIMNSAASNLMGEGSASDTDPRGKKYTHNWADISHYADNDDIVAKFYYNVTEQSGNVTYGTGRIKGEILNNSGKDINYASVEFGLYNGDAKYASCYDNISSLKANSKWSFEAGCLSWRKNTTVKIEDISWY